MKATVAAIGGARNILIQAFSTTVKSKLRSMLGKGDWSLSPAYDPKPVPTDRKARVLTTNIDLEEGTCSLDLLKRASENFVCTLTQARAIIKEIATLTATQRDTAKALGARTAEINRVASALEHDDLKRPRTLEEKFRSLIIGMDQIAVTCIMQTLLAR